MGPRQQSEILTALWRFVRGDTPSAEFERWIYLNPPLEEALGAPRYLELVSVNFKDPEQVDRARASLRELALSASNLACLCITLPDLAVVDMGEHEEVFASLDQVRHRGSPFWWLSAYACRSCQEGWLVAQEERQNDIFCMRRLAEDQLSGVLDQGVWPEEFDRYEALLRIGLDFGRSVRFMDPIGSSSLFATITDLARERPGIAVSELSRLLNLEHAIAEEIARAVVAREGLQIELDLPD